jgi:hypothetical protein
VGLHSPIFPQKKAPAKSLKPSAGVVPEAGIEPAERLSPEVIQVASKVNS